MSSLEDLSPDARDELALIARQLAENPATRNDFLRMTKKVKPDITIDTIDLEDRFSAQLQQRDEQVNELRAKLMEKEALETLKERRQSLLEKGKVSTKDDIEKVEKIMLEKGINNHETAAEYWAWMNKSQEPTSSQNIYSPNDMNQQARDTLSKFWSNSKVAAREEAAKALDEIRRNPKAIGI